MGPMCPKSALVRFSATHCNEKGIEFDFSETLVKKCTVDDRILNV